MGSESGLRRSSGLRDLVTEDSHPVGICWSWKMGEVTKCGNTEKGHLTQPWRRTGLWEVKSIPEKLSFNLNSGVRVEFCQFF